MAVGLLIPYSLFSQIPYQDRHCMVETHGVFGRSTYHNDSSREGSITRAAVKTLAEFSEACFIIWTST